MAQSINKCKQKPGRKPARPDFPLRSLMECNGLSSAKFAKRSGCSQGHLNKILRGQYIPRRQLLRNMASVLRIDVGALWSILDETQTKV